MNFEQKFILDVKQKIIQNTDEDGTSRKHKKLKLIATITGDLHHYARYEQIKPIGAKVNVEPKHRITVGGGGAFLHGTHFLPEDIKLISPKDWDDELLSLKAVFPNKEESRKLFRYNILLFPFKSWQFTLLAR